MLVSMVTVGLLGAVAFQQTDTVVPMRPGARLEISNFAGNVVVRTWPRDEMRIVADHSRRTVVDISRSGSSVRLRAQARAGPASVDYEITVPASIDVDVKGTLTSADIDGVEGEITVETTQGDIAVVGGRGFVSLQTTQGDVDLEGAEGRVDVSSSQGGIRITGASGSVYAETVTGTITLEDVTSSSVDAKTTSGSVYYDGTIEDGGLYSLGTHSGDVTVVLPEGSNVTASVSTFSGEFASAFPVTVTEALTRGGRFTFTIGSGLARLELASFSGNIELRRRGDRGRIRR